MAAGAAMNNRHTILASYHICNEVSSQLTARNNELLLHCCAVTGLEWRCALVLLVPTVSHHNTAIQHKQVPVSQVPTGPPPTSEVQGQEGPSRNMQTQAPVHPTVVARTVRTPSEDESGAPAQGTKRPPSTLYQATAWFRECQALSRQKPPKPGQAGLLQH